MGEKGVKREGGAKEEKKKGGKKEGQKVWKRGKQGKKGETKGTKGKKGNKLNFLNLIHHSILLDFPNFPLTPSCRPSFSPSFSSSLSSTCPSFSFSCAAIARRPRQRLEQSPHTRVAATFCRVGLHAWRGDFSKVCPELAPQLIERGQRPECWKK